MTKECSASISQITKKVHPPIICGIFVCLFLTGLAPTEAAPAGFQTAGAAPAGFLDAGSPSQPSASGGGFDGSCDLESLSDLESEMADALDSKNSDSKNSSEEA